MSIEALDNSTKNSLQESLKKLKNQINKSGEITYGKETLNSIPEMTLEEIKKLKIADLKDIYSKIDSSTEHQDKNGTYVIINNKKFYYTLGKPPMEGRTYIVRNEDDTSISIGKKKGDKIIGVYRKHLDDDNNIIDEYHNGYLIYNDGKKAFIPDKTNQNSASKK